MPHCIVHIDGGARGNPGPAGAGVVIVDAEDGTPVHEAGYFLGRATNNVAEYEGLVRALELASAIGADRLTLHSDSQLLVRQINGEYRVKSSDLRPLFERAQSLLRRFRHWTVEHVGRERNVRADELANRAMDARANVIELDGEAFTSTEGASGGGGSDGADRAASDASPTAADFRGDTPSPVRWTLTFVTVGRSCPAGHRAKQAFTFGPTTPAGCCIHAAAAGLGEGPLHWDDAQRQGQSRCARCGACFSLERLD